MIDHFQEVFANYNIYLYDYNNPGKGIKKVDNCYNYCNKLWRIDNKWISLSTQNCSRFIIEGFLFKGDGRSHDM